MLHTWTPQLMLNHCGKTMSAMPNLDILLEDNAFFPKAFI